MELVAGLMHGFSVALTPSALMMCVVGVVLGTIIGVMPGLGPSATIARPSTMSAQYSGALKASESLASGGATSISATTPTVPAMNEAMAAMPRAAPARPLRAIW